MSGPPAPAPQRGPEQARSLTARLTNAFGNSATALLNAGVSFIAQAPNPAPGVVTPANDMVHLLGPAVSEAADSILTPAPAPAGAAGAGHVTSMGSEMAKAAHVPAMSIESEVVVAAARAPAPAPGAAFAALASRVPAQQGPRPPLQDAIDAVAGLPGDLGLLPRLPGPGLPGSSSLQAQQGQGPQGGPWAGQAGGTDMLQILQGPGRRR